MNLLFNLVALMIFLSIFQCRITGWRLEAFGGDASINRSCANKFAVHVHESRLHKHAIILKYCPNPNPNCSPSPRFWNPGSSDSPDRIETSDSDSYSYSYSDSYTNPNSVSDLELVWDFGWYRRSRQSPHLFDGHNTNDDICWVELSFMGF